MNEPLPIDRLPHRPPMLWIQAAERRGEKQVEAIAKLPAGAGENGRGEILLGLEVLAQAAGLLLAATATHDSRPPQGRLLQVKSAQWEAADLPLESDLVASVTLRESSGIGLHQFDGVLRLPSSEDLLQADFSLLVPPV
jgi:predicted hotdog family 3-hydroxylacyl-ACP dehydratase